MNENKYIAICIIGLLLTLILGAWGFLFIADKAYGTSQVTLQVAKITQQIKEIQWQANFNAKSKGIVTITPSGGTYSFAKRHETYYSSNVLYHWRTPEWICDEEGFWRTTDGYYVVAASDLEQGTIFEGSKGLCMVLDSGCAAHTTDYYVCW